MILSKSTIQSFRSIFIIYITGIFLFAILYMLPLCHKGNLAFIDSMFVSTSCLAVTGLSTVNVLEEMTRMGQALMMIEMQLGGLGILVLISYLFMMMGRRLSMTSLILISRDQNQTNLKTIQSLSISVLLIAIIIELICSFLTYGQIRPQFDSTGEAMFVTAFHAVASFTNAGFNLFEGGFASFKHNDLMLYVTSFTIFMGSLGYPTIMEYIFSLRRRKSLFTKINIRMHAILLVAGMLAYMALEYGKAFKGLNFMDKVANAVFLSATTRNGGLTVFDLSGLTITTILIMTLLMFIGGASTSTGGGIRLTTFAVLIAKMISVVKSEEHTVIYKKTITQETINKSFLILISFLILLFSSTVALSIVEKEPIEMIVFEVVSALTNTGLSMGITEHLTVFSKIILMCLMVIGRIGIFTLIYFVFRVEKSKMRYLKEDLAVG
ncbi:potassium transporter TrkG [Bacillus testis]|uniref:potassium transporter TrkG n=1 Tax=Bacillus testis TaxID=1622072 RepID=UPI00067F6E97|nr:potassium transporter TrkG [Bacillus testis]